MAGLFFLLLLAALAFFLMFTSNIYGSKKQILEHENLPPGSMGWPLLGETLPFLKAHKSNSIGIFLQDHCSRYGKIFKSHLFGAPTIVSCDHELNMFILQNEEKLFQASYPKPMREILGKFSVVSTSGEFHKKLRNISISFVANAKSAPYFLLFVEKLSISFINSWKDRKQISFHREIKEFTTSLMVKLLLSVKPEEPLASKILKDFLTHMKGFVSLPINIPGTAYANAIKARGRLSSTVSGIMKKRKEKMEKGELTTGNEDFLDMLMSKQSLSDEQTVSIVLDLLLAGFEATATVIALIVYFLSQSPDAFQTLKEEHRAIRKKKEDGEPLNWADYQQMEFTSYVISEAMRCGNVVKFLHRKVLDQDVNFKEFVLPAGWKILPVFTAVHFDPFLHENPSEFNPWRWTDKGTNKKVTLFGGGPRLCPGAELSRVEIAFFLHHLILTHGWKIQADEFPIARPYVEFNRGLLLEFEALNT